MSNWTLNEKSTGVLTVTVEGDAWKSACKKAFNKIAKGVEVKGFRKGSVPAKILEREINKQHVYAVAIDDNANEWFGKALEEEKLMPINQASMDMKEVSDEKVVLEFTFSVPPTVELGDYKSLTYTVPEVEVSEEEFNAELDRMREVYADMEEKDGAAEEGDTVEIDYEGFKDGVPFEGGKAEGFDLVLGSHSFIEGFEEKLIGSKAGEEKELDLTFPEEYPAKELAGAPVVFKVKVNKVKTKVLPEVNDDFAKDLNAPDVNTAEDLKKMVRTRLENGKKAQAENEAVTELMNKLADVTTVEIPDVMVEDEINGKLAEMGQQLQQYGISVEQYLSMMGKKIEDVKAELYDEAHKSVKVRLALEEVAKKENLEATEEMVEEEFNRMAEAYKMEVETIKQYVNPIHLKLDLVRQQAFNLLKGEAVEKKPAKKATKKTAEKKTAEKKPAAKKTTTKKATTKKTTKKAETKDAE